MKKIFSFALMLLGMATALTSCSDDRDSNPTIGQPTQFVVNPSPLAGQYIQLSADNKVNLTWSQPDFGYNAQATYQIQVGVSNGGNITWNEKDGADKYLESTFTQCNADINGEEIAEAICEIDGVEDEEHYVDLGFREIAFRVKASILDSKGNDVPGTVIVSAPVTFEHMAAYCAIKSLGFVYIIGSCHGWLEPSKNNAEALTDWRIFETEIGSKIYKGVVEMPEGDLTFRIYTALTGWDGGNSLGHQADDVATDVEFTDGVYNDNYVYPGKGSWTFVGFPGGNLEITLDMIQGTIKIQQVQ
ncbi:MAG: SusE domain-containing protein [Prevotella sp.]|nr:SusE domain-containing protein [Prevotella sp.]